MGNIVSDATTGVIIGIDNVHWAELLKDEKGSTKYGVPIPLENTKSMSITGNATISSLYADNRPIIVSKGEGEHAVVFEKADFSVEQQATLLGHTIDSHGGIASKTTDIPPYGAIGGRLEKSNGSHRLFWMYKGIFTEPDMKGQSGEATKDFQIATINGTFIDRKADGYWRYMIDTDSPLCNDSFVNNFFTKSFLETLVNAQTVYNQPANIAAVTVKPTISNAKPGVIYYVTSGSDSGKAFYTTGTVIKEIKLTT